MRMRVRTGKEEGYDPRIGRAQRQRAVLTIKGVLACRNRTKTKTYIDI